MMKRIMRRKKEIIRVKVVYKLFVVLIVLCGIFYIISMLLNFNGEKIYRQEVMNSIEARLLAYIQEIETEMDKIMNVQNLYSNDMDLQMLGISKGNISDYEELGHFKNIQKSLYMFENTSTYIDEVSVYVPSIEKLISSKYTIDIIALDTFMGDNNKVSYQGDPFIYNNSNLYILKHYPRYSIDKIPLYVVKVKLNKDRLLNVLKIYFSNTGVDYFILDNKKEWIINNGDISNDQALISNVVMDVDSDRYVGKGHSFESNRMNSLNKPMEKLDAHIVVYLNQDMFFTKAQMYRKFYVYITVVMLILLMVVIFYTSYIIAQPMKRLVKGFYEVKKGHWEYKIEYASKDEFKQIYEQFNKMVDKIDILLHQVYEQRLLTTKAELRQLQYQIKPHFLYNTIYIIYRMAKKKDNEGVEKVSKHLSGYYKYITKSSEDLTRLKDEMNHTRDYMEIQNIRFSYRITTCIGELPRELEEEYISPLIIQPLVENAYGHGLEDISENGRIEICVQGNKERYIITVRDNGKGMSVDAIEEINRQFDCVNPIEVTGIFNINRRIKLQFGSASGLKMERNNWGGIDISIMIQNKENTQSKENPREYTNS